MKKAFVFALVLALVMSMTVSVCAATSSSESSIESIKPSVVPSEDGEIVVSVLSPEEAQEDLSEEDQAVFEEAKETLVEAVPQGSTVMYLFHVEIHTDDKSATVTLALDDYENPKNLSVIQYIDGEWVEKEFTLNDDGTITILEAEEGPMAIVENRLSLLDPEEGQELSEEAQAVFEEAEAALADVTPEGMQVLNFVHVEIHTDEDSVGVTVELGDSGDYENVSIMQFIDGEWVELEFTRNDDGTVTIFGVAEGPMAIFAK